MAFFKAITNFLNKNIGPPSTQVSVAAPSPSPSSIQNLLKITPEPINVSGFYNVTGPTEATFYAITDKPIVPMGPGWYSDFVIGVQGTIRVKSVSLDSGPGYIWSFVFQVGTNQNIEGTRQVASTTLYPSKDVLFTPGKFTNYSSPQNILPNVQVKMNSNIQVGNYAKLRDLNKDVSWTDYQPDGRIFPQSPMIEPGTGIKGWTPP